MCPRPPPPTAARAEGAEGNALPGVHRAPGKKFAVKWELPLYKSVFSGIIIPLQFIELLPRKRQMAGGGYMGSLSWESKRPAKQRRNPKFFGCPGSRNGRFKNRTWARSSAGRAPRSQRGGRGFDPLRVHQSNIIRTCSPSGTGSGLLFIWTVSAHKESGPCQLTGGRFCYVCSWFRFHSLNAAWPSGLA